MTKEMKKPGEKISLAVSCKTRLYCNLKIQCEYTSIALFSLGLDYGLKLSFSLTRFRGEEKKEREREE